MISTYLCDSQLNNPLHDPNVQTLLNEVKELTGTDWQILPQSVPVSRWFGLKTDTVLMYSLYVYVGGGVAPWQKINFYSSPEEFSINTLVDIDTIANFLMGVCDRSFQH